MSFTANALNTRGFVAASQYRIGSLINKLSDSGSASSHLKHVISVAMKGGKCPDFYSEKESMMQKRLSSIVYDQLLRNKETHRQMMSPSDYRQRIFAELPLRAFNEKLLTKDQLVPKGFFRKPTNVFEYELREKTSPSQAIESFIEGPSIVDTGVAAQVVFLKIVKDQIKEDRFDALFSRADNRLQINQGGSLDVNCSVSLAIP